MKTLTPQEETTERLIDHLDSLTIDELEQIPKQAGDLLFMCPDNEAINLHLRGFYTRRGNWYATLTESAFSLSTHDFKVSELLIGDQIEIISLIEEII